MESDRRPRLEVLSRPALYGDATPADRLVWPVDARAIVLVVHPDAEGPDDAGQRFIADVLNANGLATLSFGLGAPGEAKRAAPMPDEASVATRLHEALAWWSECAGAPSLPVAVIGVHEAAAACARALRHGGLETIRACVWMDADVALGPQEVAAWERPTLCIVGRHGSLGAPQPLRGVRRLPAPHRVVKLPLLTRPRAAAGAYQAMACQMLAWLQAALPPAELSALPAMAPPAARSCGAGTEDCVGSTA